MYLTTQLVQDKYVYICACIGICIYVCICVYMESIQIYTISNYMCVYYFIDVHIKWERENDKVTDKMLTIGETE